MHKLLATQLRDAGQRDGAGPDVDRLIAAVGQTYEELDRAASAMEKELRDANAKAKRDHDAILAAILHNSSDGMLVVESGTVIVLANRAAEREFSAAPGKLAGLSVCTLFAPNAEVISRAPDSGGGFHESLALAFDGRTFPVELSRTNLEISGASRQLWIVRDISERVRAQQEILASRIRFQDFAEASSDCFWEMDGQLENVSMTSSFEPELSSRIAELLAPGDAAPAGLDDDSWRELRRQLTAQRRIRISIQIPNHNGEALYLSITGKPVQTADGAFGGYRGTARNVTREVLAREAARRAEQRLVEAIDPAPSAMALLDAGLAFVAGNSALKALARSAGEILNPGRGFGGFLKQALKPGDEDGSSNPSELLRALAADGQAREVAIGRSWYLLAARALSDGGMVLNLSDVTTLKQRECELAEAKLAAESASRLKSEFLATMSHELRTPLNAILGFSEVIRDQVFGAEGDARTRYMEYAGSIHDSGRHLLSLISEILDLSKIEAGTYLLDREPLDLSKVLQSAVTIIGPAARKSGVELRMNIPDHPVIVLADDRALRQIALNLLANAVKFTPSQGSVAIDVTEDGENAEFSVTDTGIGIAREHVGSVFELFRQVDASLQRRHEGTGLGLAITKRLVELHGGTISLESELAVGTAVHVRLPLAGSRFAGQRSDAAA